MKSAEVASEWFNAIFAGDASTVIRLLHRCKGWYNADGYTALMLAGVMGNIKLIRILLEHESSLLSRNEDMTALMLVTLHGSVESAKIIREAEARKQNTQGLTALILACINNNEEMIALLSRRETGCRTVLGETSLMYLVRQNNHRCMHYVMEMELKAQMNSGYSALMMAAELGHYECAQLLADRENCLQNCEGETALMIAIRKGHFSIAKLLVRHEKRYQNAEGWSSLMLSVRYNMQKIAEKLVKDEQGMFSRNNISSLMLSIWFDMPDITAHLIQKESGITIRSLEETAAAVYHHMKPKHSKVTTSHHLRRYGFVDVAVTNSKIPISLANIDLLSNKDVVNDEKLDAALKPGRTAYMIAALKRNFKVMKELHECESGRQDHDGTTAAMIVLGVMYDDLCSLLMQIENGTDRESLYTFVREGVWHSYCQALHKLLPKEARLQNNDGMTLLMLAVEHGVKLAERIRAIKRNVMLVNRLGRETFFSLLDPNLSQESVNKVFADKLGLVESGVSDHLGSNPEEQTHEYSVSIVENELTGSHVSVSVSVSFPANILESDEGSIEQSIRALKQRSWRKHAAQRRSCSSKSEGTKLSIKHDQLLSSDSSLTEKQLNAKMDIKERDKDKDKDNDEAEIVQSTALQSFVGYTADNLSKSVTRSPIIKDAHGKEVTTRTGLPNNIVHFEDALDSEFLDCADYYNYEADTDMRIMLRDKVMRLSACFMKRYPDELEDLCALAWSVHIELVRLIAGYEAKMHNVKGQTALMFAVMQMHNSVAELLVPLEKGLQDSQGNTALMHLILTTYNLSLKIEPIPAQLHHANSLLQGRRGIDSNYPKNTYVLYERPVIRQMLTVLDTILPYEKGLQNRLGQSALIFAAANGNFDAVRVLLATENGRQDNYGYSALMYAIRSRNVNCALLLIAQEAHLVTWRKETALMVAARYGVLKVCLEILKSPTSLIRKQNDDGCTALIFAAANGHVEVVKLLHDYEFTKQDVLGQTAAIHAVLAGHTECVKLLVEEFDIIDNSGQTIIQVANRVGRTEIVELLDLLFDG